MGYDDVSLGKKKDENFDYKFAFDVKSEDDTNLSFYPINTSYPVIDLHAYSEHSLFSQIITDGLGNLLATLGKQLFEFLKAKITERYGKAAVLERFFL